MKGVSNRTLLYGEGLFETILWKGINRRLKRHYERLRLSAEFFRIPCPAFEEFVGAIMESAGGERDIYIKYCLLSEGEGLFYKEPTSSSALVIKGAPPMPPGDIALTFSPYTRHSGDPIIYHKTMNYTFNIMVKRDALARGFYDALVLNERGLVTECSSSNLIVFRSGRFATPSRECGILKGTTINALSEAMRIEDRELSISHISEAEGLFIANSLIGVVPVRAVDGHSLNIDRAAQQDLMDILRAEEIPD